MFDFLIGFERIGLLPDVALGIFLSALCCCLVPCGGEVFSVRDTCPPCCGGEASLDQSISPILSQLEWVSESHSFFF